MEESEGREGEICVIIVCVGHFHISDDDAFK